MWLRDPLPHDLIFLCENMRPADALEILPLRRQTPLELAAMIYSNWPYARVAFVAGVDGSPRAVAFLGLWPIETRGEFLSAQMFATAEFSAIARPFVHHVRRNVIPPLLAEGVRRVECRVHAWHVESRRLLKALGAVEEATLLDYGADGSTYILCAWRRSDWRPDDVLQPNEPAAPVSGGASP